MNNEVAIDVFINNGMLERSVAKDIMDEMSNSGKELWETLIDFGIISAPEDYWNVIAMEVGALLVGKIVNHHGAATVRRGQEKGYFQFGGSTVVLLLKKDTAVLDSDILENSRQGIETVVKFGEKIGAAK